MFNAVNFHLSTALAAAYKSAMLLLCLYLVILTSVLVLGWLLDQSFRLLYNKIPQTGWFINNRNIFLTVLESQKSKIKTLAGLVSDEGSLHGLQVVIFSLCPHMVEREQSLLMSPLIRPLIPFMRVPSSSPNYLPEAPPLNTITLEIQASTSHFRRTQTFIPLQGPNGYETIDKMISKDTLGLFIFYFFK